MCYRPGKLSSALQREAVDIDSRLFSYCREPSVVSYGPAPSLLRGVVAVLSGLPPGEPVCVHVAATPSTCPDRGHRTGSTKRSSALLLRNGMNPMPRDISYVDPNQLAAGVKRAVELAINVAAAWRRK